MSLIDIFVPPGISGVAALMLAISAFFTSAISAGFGIGGGVVLLAIMTQVVPVAVLIPVHGVVQVGSNFFRAIIQFRHAQLWYVGFLLIGFVIGAVAGGQIFVSLPDNAIIAAVGLFILWSAWGSLPPLRSSGRGLIVIGGAIATVLTMFVGATGPFVLAILRRFDLDKTQMVGTHAVAMVLQHALKVVVFGALGFAFGDWLPLMLAMIASGFLGTVAGTKLLHRMPEQSFKTAVKVIMTLIAIELIVEALIDTFA